MPSMDLPLPDGLPTWLAAFVREALQETDALRENGAEQAAAAACSAPFSRSASVSCSASRTKAASQVGRPSGRGRSMLGMRFLVLGILGFLRPKPRIRS